MEKLTVNIDASLLLELGIDQIEAEEFVSEFTRKVLEGRN